MIRFVFVMAPRNRLKARERVTVNLPRPTWWRDAVASERAWEERKALDSDAVQHALARGLMILEVIKPRCECVVQAVKHRDPEWAGANGSCKRCGGPLAKKGQKGWVS